MKAEFRSSSDVDDILKNAHKLKANSELKSVYRSPDRTKEQRSAHGKLVNQIYVLKFTSIIEAIIEGNVWV